MIVAMPYGVLDPQRLSQASRSCAERALDWWQKSMQTTKHKTYLVLAGYDVDHGQEIKLRRDLVDRKLQDPELIGNIVEVSANNEIGLTQKISRIRALLPVETITVFVEARNAISVKAIFKRKFGKTLQIRKFQANFEFNHQWITTSTSIAWSARNWSLRLWFELKKRMGRGLRKKIRYWFRW
ncbi:MAG: hypothetical protein ACXWXT_04505 [Candidatus Binatia bacterium]